MLTPMVGRAYGRLGNYLFIINKLENARHGAANLGM